MLEIPGLGVLTATAAVAIIGDAKVFKLGREFAACVGIVPKQKDSGGKIGVFGIPKRGDTYLCALLIHGMRSVLAHVKDLGPWLQQLCKHRPPNVVALPNKMAQDDLGDLGA